jgi:histidinol-phosphate aminotransferase
MDEMKIDQPATTRESGLRLHFNENTAGCSPAVLAALRTITPEDISFYPDYGAITTTVEHYFGVPAGWAQLTNGLDEGLHVAAQWAARHERPAVIIPEPAFEMYEISAEGVGAEIVRVAPEPDFRFPIEAILRAIRPSVRLIYLNDPNNPTGLGIPAGDVERIAASATNALVIVDEAYADFSGRTLIGPVLDRRRNLIVGRTFAKAHGLAALRVGALVAHPETLAPLRRLLPPYGLNICAVRALAAAIEDTAYRDWYVGEARDSRQAVYDFAIRRSLACWPSEANFVLVRVGDDAPAIVAGMAARGIHVRDKSAAPGCAGCIRITTGIVSHTRQCLEMLDEVLAARRR